MKNLSFKFVLSVVFISFNSYSYCDKDICNVKKFPGSNAEKINRAIEEASLKRIKKVFLPNGNYWLRETINFSQQSIDVELVGESKNGVQLIGGPIIDENNCMSAIINVDRSGGFSSVNLKMKNFTRNYEQARYHPVFKNGGCSSSGHGIRVGNGWNNGRLQIDNVDIIYTPGYGIGIQTSGQDLNANNVILTNILIKKTGMDGLDTKAPDRGRNKNLTIINMFVDEIGYNDEGSAAALDISYENFYIRDLKIKTAPMRSNPRGVSVNTGIRFRGGARSARNGTVKNFHIKGANHAVFFEGKDSDLNDQITMRNFAIEGYQDTGIYLRGKGHSITHGCIEPTPGKAMVHLNHYNLDWNSILLSFKQGLSGCHPTWIRF